MYVDASLDYLLKLLRIYIYLNDLVSLPRVLPMENSTIWNNTKQKMHLAK